jgi:hypothetical protein
MIGKSILDVGFSRLAEPDEIGRDAMRNRCDQRKDIPPYTKTGQVDLANRRIQPLCHLSAACFQQLP